MKAKIVLAGLLMSMMVAEVSAQHAEYDDMYFRGKDREKNKAIDAEEAYASAKTKKQKPDEVTAEEEQPDNVNPTDSYSARNVNPEYVSRSNSEKASEDETNYYLEGYKPAASTTSNFNNSYYNNANPANNSYYANNSWNSPYYGGCGCNSYMSPSYGYGGFGPSYGLSSGLSVSLMFGNYWSPYAGYGMYSPYGGGYSYPYGGYGYPNYYGANNYYNESPHVVNYGKRPSRHSAVVQPTQRTRTHDTGTGNIASVNSNSNRVTRPRQVQDEYYVRPARRTPSSIFDNNSVQRNSGNRGNSLWTPSTSQPTRTRESYSPPARTPSYTPSYSPSRGGSGGSGGGGSSSPHPRGRN